MSNHKKTSTYKIPSVVITDEDIKKAEKAIEQAEKKAWSNTFSFTDLRKKIDIAIFESFKKPDEIKPIKEVRLGGVLYSKSKQFYTTATVLTIHFYKDGKVKKIEAQRASFSNKKCYNGYDTTEVRCYE